MRAIDHACRLQFTALAQFAVRSLKDWEVIMEEFTAAIDPKVFQQMYGLAMPGPYGILIINLVIQLIADVLYDFNLIFKK